MFLHLTDTTAKLQGDTSVKTLIGEGKHLNTLYSYAYPLQQEQWEELYKMQIHLAENSDERGQYQSRIDTQKKEHLLSYVYKNKHGFDKTWETQTREMQIYLAGHTANEDTEQTRKNSQNHLSTFANQKEVSTLMETIVDRKKLPRILIDSGAFTAFTTGKIIKVEDYAEWALNFKAKWEPLVRSLHFFNLDVIGDESASDVNLIKLERLGLNPLPIFTFHGDEKYLKKYLDNYPYIGFGGLVGKPTAIQKEWLDYCFGFVIGKYKKTGVMPRVHLLGVTKQDILERYPVYSCDSSSWVKCLRFGGGDAIGKNKIPRYKESPEAMKITIATLKAEIRKYQKMEKDVTELWRKRGIVWDD